MLNLLGYLPRYRKTVTAIITSMIGWVTMVVVSDSSSITSMEWIALATALAIAGGVYQIPNDPPAGVRASGEISERRK